MSQENVEIWRSFLDDLLAANESNWEQWLARIPEILDPEIKWDASQTAVPDLAGVYRGIEAVVQWWRQWLAAWETTDYEYELVDAGDQVVLLLDQRMRGRSTGIEVALGEYAQLATFTEGRIVHWKVYVDQSKALEAAGLSE